MPKFIAKGTQKAWLPKNMYMGVVEMGQWIKRFPRDRVNLELPCAREHAHTPSNRKHLYICTHTYTSTHKTPCIQMFIIDKKNQNHPNAPT